MTDAATRAHERRAAAGDPEAEVLALVARMRAGELTRSHVELAAYCGDEASRLLVPKPCVGDHEDGGCVDGDVCWEHQTFLDFDVWLEGIRSTAKNLPDVQGMGDRECPDPCKNGQRLHISQATGSWGMHSEHACETCHSTGRVPYTVPAPRYAMALAAVAAARVAFDVWADVRAYDGPDVRSTIEAAEAWLQEPTQERLEAWRKLGLPLIGPGLPPWISGPNGGHADSILEAVTAAGEQPVREAISRALIKWAL